MGRPANWNVLQTEIGKPLTNECGRPDPRRQSVGMLTVTGLHSPANFLEIVGLSRDETAGKSTAQWNQARAQPSCGRAPRQPNAPDCLDARFSTRESPRSVPEPWFVRRAKPFRTLFRAA